MKILPITIFIFFSMQLVAQQESISYRLNGRYSNKQIQDSIELSKNPFAKFIGEWTLKNDTWVQNWGGATDTLLLLQHHTTSSKINTENSLLSIIDGPEPNGHIFWSYDPKTKEIYHLSSFGTIRAGHGKGEFYGEQNLRLKLRFQGEPQGTYRIYTYEWVNDSEYALHAIQYNENNKPTGLFYKGNFIRIDKDASMRQEINDILDILDNNQIPIEEQVSVYADKVLHMAPDNNAINTKEELFDYLKQQKSYGHSVMEHSIVGYEQHGDIIVMRGRVEGIFYPSNGSEGVPFKTKNLFIFQREHGKLKIAKVIYNRSPNK